MTKKISIIIANLMGFFFLSATLFLIVEYKSSEVPEDQCKIARGTIAEIGSGGSKDLTFTLAKNETCFYINRGLDNQFNLKNLSRKMLGKKVVIYYSNHTNILTSKNSGRQIRKLCIGNSTFYNEFKNPG